MANDNKRKTDPRQAALDRTRVRVIAVDRTDPQRKKQQERLARQEQKLAEKAQRQAERQAQKEQRAQAPAPKKEKSPRPAAADSASVVKRPSENGKTGFAGVGHRAKEEFQVILGGRGRKVAGWLGFAAILVAVVILVNAAIPISLFEYVENVFAGAGTGDGFPVQVSSATTTNMLAVGSDVALLGDSSVSQYKSNGKLLYDRQHGFNNPAFCACSARVLVYDRGGKSLRMENRARTLFSLETAGAITTADLADNGAFAVVTRASNYVSDVTVYSAAGKERYVWRSSTRQVTAVSLSGNGRYLAVGALHVEGGEAVTDLLMFDTRRDVTLFEEKYEGSVLVSLDCKGTTAVALFPDRISSVTKIGQRQDLPFEGSTLSCYDNHLSNGTALVLEPFGNARDHRLLVLDKNLRELGSADLNTGAVALSAKGGYVDVLTRDRVLFFNRKGVLRSEAPLSSDANMILCRGSRCLVLGSGLLQEVSG